MRRLAFAPLLLLAACSRTPEEPNPVPNEMKSVEAKPMETNAPPATTTIANAPSPKCPADPAPQLNKTMYGHGRATFVTPDGARHDFDVEIAESDDAQERGLMFRTSLAETAGMVFAFQVPHQAVFWMKNTCIPLDMLYLGKDGTVVGVLEGVPVLNDAPRAVQCKAAYVLEVNAGWSREHGVTPGMKARISL